MQQTERRTLFSNSTLAKTASLSKAFATAAPFKHVVIDNFFEHSFAADLLTQFPKFDQGNAIDEYGGKSRKAVVEGLSALSSAFQDANGFFASSEFLTWISELTGIPNLLYNSDNYGGGTHENLEGQELLPHVDFNYHPKTGHHRRLNLIVYLNPAWQEDWGGSIQVHSDPRNPASNNVQSFAPIFNRCIIFETNERSWHGFDRIKFPDSQKGNSRKSLSIYLYTTERPENESFAPHGTFYVPRALPDDFVAGKVLCSDDIATLQYLLRTRDDLIKLQQQKEAARESAAAKLAEYSDTISRLLSNIPVPMLGYVLHDGTSSGIFPDRWCGAKGSFGIRAVRDVKRITVRGSLHRKLQVTSSITVSVNDREVARGNALNGHDIEATAPLELRANETASISLESPTLSPCEVEDSEDRRHIGFHLHQVIFEH